MSLEPGNIELILKHIERQIDELRQRADDAARFGNKLVGGLVVVGLVVGGMQFFVARQIALLDALRNTQTDMIERVIVLEVEGKFHRQPPPNDKARSQ